MDINDELVVGLAQQAAGFHQQWNGDQAEQQIAANTAAYRAPHQRTIDGVMVDTSDPTELAQLDAKWRSAWDQKARTAGLDLEVQIDGALAVLEGRIEEARRLTPWLEAPVSRGERQTEELIGLFVEDKWRARLATLTRTQALELYTGADEQQQADRRMVAVVEAAWPTLTFRDDPEHDAEALRAWTVAREARQMARVDTQLLTWAEQLRQARNARALNDTMTLLRSGYSLAVPQWPRAVPA